MFKGSIVALATPYTEADEVDYDVIRQLIEWHIHEGTDGIVLCGSTGESAALSDEEQLQIINEGVVCSQGRIPIIAGTGSYDTRHSVQSTEAAQKAGADGCLVVQPYYNRPTPEGCLLHFQEIGKVGLPIIVYHHPGRTGIKLPVKWLAKISEIPSVACIKEATGDLDFILELLHTIQKPVLSGDDSLAIPILASGGVGTISIVANILPGPWKELITHLMNERLSEAKELYRTLYPLVKAMVLETNPQCVKYALGLMGKCRSAMRLPLIEPQENTRAQIALALDVVQNGSRMC